MCEVCRLVDQLVDDLLESGLTEDQQAMAAFRLAAMVAVAGQVRGPGRILDEFVRVTRGQDTEGTH
jgi:hypothetical protein